MQMQKNCNQIQCHLKFRASSQGIIYQIISVMKSENASLFALLQNLNNIATVTVVYTDQI